MMIVVSVIGCATFAVQQMFFANTVYSVGYDESPFQKVHLGMTSAEIEERLGPPLEKVPWWQPDISGRPVWGQPGDVNWLYSKRRPGCSNYWMRNVLMEDGKVIQVQSGYWVD
jgi:hypothetical protein